MDLSYLRPSIKLASNPLFTDLLHQNKIRCVFVNWKSKKISRIFPTEKVHTYNMWDRINVHDLLCCLIGQMMKLCGIKKRPKQKLRSSFVESVLSGDIDESSASLINLKIDNYPSGEQDYRICELKTLFKTIELTKESQSFHEYFSDNRAYRFFMDIDNDDTLEIINLGDIMFHVESFVKQTFGFTPEFLSVWKNDFSNCYHIYGNFACSLNMMKTITSGISKYIDINVYNVNRSLWVCNSYKYDHEINRMQKTYYPISEDRFEDTILQNTSGLLELSDNICL